VLPLFIAVLALITYGSLYPWHFVAAQPPHSPLWMLFHSLPKTFDRYFWRDIVVNIVLYIPAGLTGHLAFRRFGRFWLSLAAPILICTALSASVEMLQLFVPPRDCSLLDLITNIAGTIAGVLVAVVFEDVFLFNRQLTRPKKQPDQAALALLACLVLSQLFPLFPVMGRTLLRQKLGIFLHTPPWAPIVFLSAAVTWFAAGGLCRAASLRPARRILAFSVLLIPAQFFVVDRQPHPAALLGTVAGTAAFVFTWQKRTVYATPYWKILAGIFLSTIVARGLAPLNFTTVSLPFSWTPFGAFLLMDWERGLPIIIEKFFWYGTAVWIMIATGLTRITATALVAALLLAVELAQTHLPGHVAEITDPLIAIFASFALAMVTRQRPQPD